MRDDDLDNAERFLERGLEIAQRIGAPVAEWRIHRVASELYRLKGRASLRTGIIRRSMWLLSAC